MAVFELVSGDFERADIRLRYSEAGRAYVRLTSIDGVVEDVFLARDIAGVAESGEGRVGEYLTRWAERDGFAARDQRATVGVAGEAGGRDGRGERLFVVLLRDGRKFVARGSLECVVEIKAASLSADRRAALGRLDQARAAATERTARGLLPRFVPGLFARLLPSR